MVRRTREEGFTFELKGWTINNNSNLIVIALQTEEIMIQNTQVGREAKKLVVA